MRILDRIVCKVAGWPAWLRVIARPFLYPLIFRRMKGIARVLATYKRLPAVSWKDVEKHGQNAVFGYVELIDVSTKAVTKEIWVADSKNRTVRMVFDIPDQYQEIGAQF